MQGVTLTPPKKESCPQDSKDIHEILRKFSPSIEEITTTRYGDIHEYDMMWKIFRSLTNTSGYAQCTL